MKPHSVYICGPMRGYANHNYPAFIEAARKWRERGFSVVSPVEVNGTPQEGVSGDVYLRNDLVAIALACSAIALLPGWEASTGARCEVAVALSLGLTFYNTSSFYQIERPELVCINGGYEKQPGRVEGEFQKYALNVLAAAAHKANVTWWTDLKTGQRKERNVGELLMLATSELAEAMEGHRKNLQDDKLPHRKMFEVELADCLVRIFDMAGGLGLDIGGAFVEKMAYNAQRADHKPENRLADGGKKY